MAVDDANTIVLHHFNGPGASVFTDESGKTWTPTLSAYIDTGEKKFGAASAHIVGAGGYVTTPNHADFNMGSGDFTIDFWINFITLPTQSASSYVPIISKYVDDNNFWALAVQRTFSSTYISFGQKESSSWTIDTNKSSWTLAVGAWHHYAVIKASNVYKFSYDGTLYAASSGSPDTTALNNFATTLRIGDTEGGSGTPAMEEIKAYIDELRISNVARWAANFTPSTSEYGPTTAVGFYPKVTMVL